MPSSASCRLLLFLRYPQVGRTKTRLIPALGAAGAATLQRHMAEYLVRRLQHPSWELQVHFSGASVSAMQDFLGPELVYRPQVGQGLGDRLWYGFQQGFKEDSFLRSHAVSRTIAIGADCPDVSHQHIHQAFDALRSQDVVLGPATDGGYYLIGLRQASERCCADASTLAGAPAGTSLQSLFKGIDWSTPRVFQQTLARVQQLNLSWAQLETLSDVDRPEDLAIWERLQVLSPQIR
ncbi:MAG: TIGR04282 family arsenosugar biosynthesis glycosyltransferase [Phormidesmis sp.]